MTAIPPWAGVRGTPRTRTRWPGERAGPSAKRAPILLMRKAASGIAGRVLRMSPGLEIQSAGRVAPPSEDSARTPLARTSASTHSSFIDASGARTVAQTVAFPARISKVSNPGRSGLTDCTTPATATRLYAYAGSCKFDGETETDGGCTPAPRAARCASTIAGAGPPEEARPEASTRQPVAGKICPGARLTRIPPVES